MSIRDDKDIILRTLFMAKGKTNDMFAIHVVVHVRSYVYVHTNLNTKMHTKQM